MSNNEKSVPDNGPGQTLAFLHCMMHVSDLPAAIEFYDRVLGFKVVDRHRYDGHALVYMRKPDGGMEIELICPDGGINGEVADGRLWHMAFSVADLKAEYRRLLALDYRLVPIDSYSANGAFMCNFLYIYDPDGHQIEIIESHGRYQDQA